MFVKMILKVTIFATALFVAVYCQHHHYQAVIDQTQYLQEIEKYGNNQTHQSNSLYPSLNHIGDHKNVSTDHNRFNNSVGGPNGNQFNKTTGNQFNQTTVNQFNATERFLNKTISNMQKGICVKEVPTASLGRANEVVGAGNGSDPSLSRIQVCCEGYHRNIYNFRKCDPICKTECVNGFCAAPDTCVCYPDHVINSGGFCIPTCPIGCGNGVCQRDNSCACKDGYKLESHGKFCVAKCSSGCQNGNCTAPEQCTCFKGYSLSSLTGKCEPVCSHGCMNGNCVAPEQCQCNKGYLGLEEGCQPICSKGCQNGFCVAPETCECPGHGWTLDQTGSKCTASCDKACMNGICTGPNQCTCRNGYVLDSVDSFRCVPKCDTPCVNGICSGPNLCLCYQGFIKDRSVKGSQKCVRA